MHRGLVAQRHLSSVCNTGSAHRLAFPRDAMWHRSRHGSFPDLPRWGGGVRHRAGLPWDGTDPALSPQRELRPRLCTMKRGANGYGFNLHSDKSKPGQFIRSVDPDSPAEASGLQAQDRIVEVMLLAVFPGWSFLTTSSQISRSWGRHHTVCSSVSPRGLGSL